jgi:hypothetical protein
MTEIVGMRFDNKSLRGSGFDNWLTDPKNVLPRVRKCLGTIDLDPASNIVAQQYVQASEFCVSNDDYRHALDKLGIDGIPHNLLPDDGLSTDWDGNVFCNPPYSGKLIGLFVNKFIDEIVAGNVTRGLFLVNSATDSKWYHSLIQNTTCYLLWKGRIKFWKIFDGKAHEKWEGEKSKAEGKGKIGNSPRYLNTLFYYDRHDDIEPFLTAFKDCGTFCQRIDG